MNGLNSSELLSKCAPNELDFGHLVRAVCGSSDGLWEWDLSTNEVWYAPRFLELLGLEPEDFPNTLDSWSSRLHPDDYDPTWAAVERHLLSGECYDVRYRLQTSTGDYSWFSARGIAYRNDSGEPFCMSGSIRNIDSVIQAEQELQEKESQLIRQQRLDAVGSLASGIAHEFNNLLQTIQGYTQFALDAHPADEELGQDLLQVLTAAQRATTLTRHLLDFSRTSEDDPYPCSIDECIRELLAMLEPILPSCIVLEHELDDECRNVLIDPQQMQQALLNLCVNARDAMSEGGTLRIASGVTWLSEDDVASRPTLAAGDYVHIVVTDSGVGIAAETLQHIFEPFFTTKEVHQGTGLGLSVAFGVVQRAGGHIECRSRIGEGTTFDLYIPTYVNSPLPNGAVVGENYYAVEAATLENG